MNVIEYRPIGIIHTPFKQPQGAPVQPRRSEGARGTVELLPEYAEGLKDLDGFSHIVLLYHLHRSKGFRLLVTPHWDTALRGVFATRAPHRPNAIGLSVVRLIRVDGITLYIRDVDMIDGTPLLDIKPYVPELETEDEIRIGWLKGKAEKPRHSDGGSWSDG